MRDLSSLFKFKKWFTISDAAQYLSLNCSEKITEADVLRLVLDGHLKISLRLIRSVSAIRVMQVDLNNVDTPELDGAAIYKWVSSEKAVFRGQEMFELEKGLFDIVFTDSVRLYIEHLRQKRIDDCIDFESEKPSCNTILIEDKFGEILYLQKPYINLKYLSLSEFI